MQECKSEFIVKLKTIFNKYHIIHSDFDTNNLCIMTRYSPEENKIINHNNNKGSILIKYHLSNGESVCFVNVHLTSEMQKNSDIKRKEQLAKIQSELSDESINVIIGDFNEQEIVPIFNTYNDIGSILPIKFTYNLKTNIISQKLDRITLPCRYDRILFNKKLISSNFQVLENIQLSDHYPIQCNFEYSLNNMKKNNECTTAITLLVPYELCEEINKIRSIYDTNYKSWMPHVTLLFGFVDFINFDKMIHPITEILKKYNNIELIFAKIERPIHEQNKSLVLLADENTKKNINSAHQRFIIFDKYSIGCAIQSTYNIGKSKYT